jgi:hypothetical protein
VPVAGKAHMIQQAATDRGDEGNGSLGRSTERAAAEQNSSDWLESESVMLSKDFLLRQCRAPNRFERWQSELNEVLDIPIRKGEWIGFSPPAKIQLNFGNGFVRAIKGKSRKTFHRAPMGT